VQSPVQAASRAHAVREGLPSVRGRALDEADGATVLTDRDEAGDNGDGSPRNVGDGNASSSSRPRTSHRSFKVSDAGARSKEDRDRHLATSEQEKPSIEEVGAEIPDLSTVAMTEPSVDHWSPSPIHCESGADVDAGGDPCGDADQNESDDAGDDRRSEDQRPEGAVEQKQRPVALILPPGPAASEGQARARRFVHAL